MKILIADDDPVTGLLLKTTLIDWGYQVTYVEDGQRAWDELMADPGIQLVIVDWMMPGIDGLELCRRLKLHSNHLCYVIMLTGKRGTKNLVEGIDAGADDFISKPFMPDELRVRLRAGARIIEQEQKLQFFAHHDELTGVRNRRMILKCLECEWQRASREKQRFLLMLFDLDKFKQVNDTYGHSAGDIVLKHFCRVVEDIIRPYDTFGRYGGEEFLLIMPMNEDADWYQVGERIRCTVAALPVTLDDTQSINISVSIGVAEKEASMTSPHDLIAQADAAMYMAKRLGGNKLVSSKELEK